VYSFAEEEWQSEVDWELLSQYIARSYDPLEFYHSIMFKNEQLRRVVEFLNPIFHPNRSERITVRLATTYIQAFFELASLDWRILMKDVIHPQLRAIRRYDNSKTFLTLYLLHLYEHCSCLQLEEYLWKQLTNPRNWMAKISLFVEKEPLASLPKEASSS